MVNILTPVRMGPYELPNRLIMAPMTRNRAGFGNAPTAINAEYYAQRASAGLIITEATQVSPQGVGYPNTPGIHSPAQVEGLKRVTAAVHDRGGRVFLQLWHVGDLVPVEESFCHTLLLDYGAGIPSSTAHHHGGND